MTHHQHQQTQGAQGHQTTGAGQFGGEPTGSQMGEGSSQTSLGSGQLEYGSGQMQHGSSQMHQGMGEQMGMGQQMGMRLSDVETPQQQTAVEDVTRAIQVCGWCADQCVQEADPSMIECIRLCEDVTELGETVLALLPRNSRYADSILGTFQQAVQACAQECGQHHHGHCQECAEVLGYASESIQELFGAYGQQGGMGGQQGGTSVQGGMGGQQMASW